MIRRHSNYVVRESSCNSQIFGSRSRCHQGRDNDDIKEKERHKQKATRQKNQLIADLKHKRKKRE